MSRADEGLYARNDGKWSVGQAVEVRYPIGDTDLPAGLPDEDRLAWLRAERKRWPWLTGEILGQCGSDEWEVIVYDKRLAELDDGSPAPAGTPGEDVFYPTCMRDGPEIREPQPEAEVEAAKRRLCAHADHDGEGMHWLEPGEKCSWTPAAQPTVTDVSSRWGRADQEAGH